MIQRAGTATIADLYGVPEKAELVNGEIVIRSPASIGHGRKSGAIYLSLLAYERRTGHGCAVPDNVGFIVDLPNRQSFSPDAAYFFGAIKEDEFVDGAPAFAAEVRSPEDFGPAAERAMAAKRTDYFAAGTQVVWDVDMIRDKVIRVYPPPPPMSRRSTASATPPKPNPPCLAGRCRWPICCVDWHAGQRTPRYHGCGSSFSGSVPRMVILALRMKALSRCGRVIV